MPDPAQYRADFPILAQQIHGKPLIYLDNAATTQVPWQVLDCMAAHYRCDNANVHRGIHTLSERSTSRLEAARETVRAFLNAAAPEEVVFTQGTTDSINLVARGIAPALAPGDEIVVTELEHHSNFVPWQQLCRERGAQLRIAPLRDGVLDREAFRALLNARTRLVAVIHVSNLTGAVHPVAELAAQAHAAGALFLVDGAQAVRHEMVDVAAMDCDFYCFSGHKMLAPSGIGVLYGRREHLEALVPARYGGGMVDTVSVEGCTLAPLPHRLEAGTGGFAQAIALGEAIRYMDAVGRAEISEREHVLLDYAEQRLAVLGGVTLLGAPERRAGCISFTVEGAHPYDLASLLDKLGIAVRSGSHCAQPALRHFGLEAAVRVSPAFYNTEEELDALCAGVKQAAAMLRKWGQR